MNTPKEIFVEHKFKTNETIAGAIKLVNGHQLHEAEMICLLRMYNELNGKVVPRPGQTVKIPIWTLGTCLYRISNT
jgi:hypothetical protein